MAFRLREKPPVLRAGLTGGGWCAIGFTHFGAFGHSEFGSCAICQIALFASQNLSPDRVEIGNLLRAFFLLRSRLCVSDLGWSSRGDASAFESPDFGCSRVKERGRIMRGRVASLDMD